MNFAELLLGLLKAAFLAYRVFIYLIIVGGCALAVWGIWRRRRRVIVLGAAIALAPAGLFLLGQTSASARYAHRQAQIAAMERHPLPPTYPRLLRVEGDTDYALVTALVAARYFDQAVVRQDNTSTRITVPHRSPACEAAGRRYLEPPRGRPVPPDYYDRRHVARLALKDCARQDVRTVVREPADDAVIMRTDTEATLRPRTEVWLNGAVEIMLRRQGREQLVDYRERPMIKRPAGMDLPFSETMDPGEPLDAGAILVETLRKVGPSGTSR